MKLFITGGAGFIGCNAAARFMDAGHRVTVFDNLSRPGGRANLAWLQTRGRPRFVRGDLRKREQVARALKAGAPDAVLHFGGQVAVTSSVRDPRHDFEVNALGTFNLLEALRAFNAQRAKKSSLLYASTNKVYGGMERVRVQLKDGRYRYRDFPRGIPESYGLDFHSPYGCSKGAADQYVHDYGRIYGFPTVVFRQSCIYGYRQFGVEDQGWVAWFTIAAELGLPVTLYGNGRQVRDVLFVDDLVDAYAVALRRMKRAAGGVYNIGGGSAHQLSLLDLLGQLENLTGRKVARRFGPWRPGDQPVFVCDTAKARRELGWKPKVGVAEGVKKLHGWVRENRALFAKRTV